MTTPRAILVTGASSGIGRATVRLLDQKGYRVFAGVRQQKVADELAREMSGCVPILMDVTNAEQIAAAVRTIESKLGPDADLAAVINCAGIAVAGPLEYLSPGDVRNTLEVNVIGQLAVIQAFLPLLRRGQGRIVQVTSGARNIGMPFLGAYVASKAGMGMIVETLRRELRSPKIPVIEILPGFVLTPLWDKYRKPADALQAKMQGHAATQSQDFTKGRALFEGMARIGKSPEAVAKVVLRAVESRCPKLRYIIGLDARLGLLSPRLIPTRILDWFFSVVLK